MTASIVLELEEPTGVARHHWPVTRGLPFPEGALRDVAQLRLLDENRSEVPLQTKSLALWADGSVRWALLHFQADLQPQATARYHLEYGPGVARRDVGTDLTVQQRDNQIIIDTGPLHVGVSTQAGLALLDDVRLGNRMVLVPGASQGFVLTEAAGRAYSTRRGRVRSCTIEEAGPLRAVVHITGNHRGADGDRLFRYELRIYAYAGLPWLELEYTFVNNQDAIRTEIQRIHLDLPLAAHSNTAGLCGAYADLYSSSEPFSIRADAPANFGLFAGTRIYDATGVLVEREGAGELSHRICHGWLDVSDRRGGLTVAIKDMSQLYPKQMAVAGSELRVDLWPPWAGVLAWHQGMARTHRLLLLFHEGTGQEARVNQLATCYEDALMLWAPGWFVESGALGPLFAHQPDRYPRIEMLLRDEFNLWQGQNQAKGFVDYGDHPQGGQFERKYYMANNEIDLGHALALQYARVGERTEFEALESIAWHTMDVDVVHHTTFDPVELGGARIHGNDHVQYNCEGIPNVSVAPSHMWTEGLLEYYYLSGHPRALEMARGIGECFLRMLDRGWAMPPYPVAWHDSRDSGWALIALTALYEATGEQRWLDGCRSIVQALAAAQGDDGGWGLRLGWYRGLSALHLGIVLTGLSRFHELTGDTQARQTLLAAADGLLDHCRFADGGMIYVDAPGYRHNFYSGVALESLGYVSQLTGDLRYLRAGLVGHRVALGAFGLRGVSSLIGTTLADWWRGNLRFMYWADKAGLLTDLPL